MGNCNYKVKITDIQNKYSFRVFCAGDTSQIQAEIGDLNNLTTTNKSNVVSAINEVKSDTTTLNSTKEDKSNKVTSLNGSSTDTQYPSAKVTYDNLQLKENTSNKVTTIDENSTDTQYPSAKCVYDSQVAQDTNIQNNATDIETLQTQYNQLYNLLPKVTGTGESITLNDTAESVMKNKLSPSELSQEGTPNPSYPQPIHTISGNNTIKVEGKNLLNLSDISDALNNEYFKDIPTNFTLVANTTYTLSLDVNTTNTPFRISVGAGTNTYSRDILTKNDLQNGRNYITFTPNESNLDLGTNLYIRCPRYPSKQTTTYTLKNIQLELGSSMTSYEPYQSQTYQVNLGELEYNAIGDYKDEFVKVDGEWFLRKNIGKVVLDGSEDWAKNQAVASTNAYFINNDIPNRLSRGLALCNYLSSLSSLSGTGIFSGASLNFCFESSDFDNETKLKTWLGTHNTIVYYQLATPQTISLSTTLQNQIESIYNETMSYKGQTNISQVNNDLAFVVDSSALKDMSNE